MRNYCDCCGAILNPSDRNGIYIADVAICDQRYTLCRACMHVIAWVSGKKKTAPDCSQEAAH
ncbi:hypothetical protein [Clostridium merdae]|uniref:hypothetical protein n=1 Tax=Clostridium merdae TaxID=1958780 RepID=UPI000A26CA15|nr:hypothetical protein [Clostridium merdae]